MRIGIISFIHESNTFISTPTTLEDFRRVALLSGDAVVEHWGNTPHEIGGFVEGVRRAGEEPVPIFSAWAMPGGVVTAETYDAVLDMILDGLDRAGPLDGLLLGPHGAGVSENHPDMDGHWLSVVRHRVGADVPLIATIDPHANLSQRMIDACDAIIAYRTNPHLDQRQTGLQAADLMVRTLRGEIRPTQAAAFPPFAINIERQMTADPPCRPMVEFADRMLQRRGVASNSIVLGFAFSDVREMGSSFIVVTDDDTALAQQHADELAAYLWEHRQQFVAHLVGIDAAIDSALRSPAPVCLLDMGDNIGGGGTGDSTFLARALHERRIPRTFVCIHDPSCVRQAEATGVGRQVSMRIGAKRDKLHGEPLEATVTVRSLHDGDYTETEVRHGGLTRGSMGRCAVVEADSGLTILLNSIRDAPLSLQQLRCCDLDPASFSILVAKGVVSPVPAYGEVCRTFVRVNTAGATSAAMDSFEYKYRRRPMFPFEEVGG
jgi:microcystin degradation protein MlrC